MPNDRPTASTTTMADVSTLDVRLHGEPIGSLTNVGGDRTVLAFTDDYIDDRDRPEGVVSGINPGWNVGHAVHASGTIGACLQASACGVPGS